MWFPYMVFRVIISVIVIYQIDKLNVNVNNILLGIIAMSYVAYPILDYLIELHEEETIKELQSKALKRK